MWGFKKEDARVARLEESVTSLRELVAELQNTVSDQQEKIDALSGILGKGSGGGGKQSGKDTPAREPRSRTGSTVDPTALTRRLTTTPESKEKEKDRDMERYYVTGHKISVYPPTSWKADEAPADIAAAPDVHLDLEYVYGFHANFTLYDVPNNPIVMGASTAVYAAAALVVVLDAKTNTQRIYAGHTNDVLSVAKGPLNKEGLVVFASGQTGKKPPIHIWTLGDKGTALVHILPENAHERGVSALAFSNSGKRLASVGLDSKRLVIIWDWWKREQLASTTGSNDAVYALAFNPFTKDDILSMAAGKAYRIMGIIEPPTKMDELKVTKRNGVLGSEGSTSMGKPQVFLSITFLGSGECLTGCMSGDIVVWNEHKLSKVLRDTHTTAVHALTRMSDGRVVSAERSGTIAIWSDQLEAQKKLQLEGLTVGAEPPGALTLAATSQGAKVMLGASDGTLRLLDLSKAGDNIKGDVWMGAHCDGELWGLASHPTQANLFASTSDDKTLRIWAVDKRKPIIASELGIECRCLDWHPDGSKIAVGAMNGSILMVTAKDGKIVHSWKKREVRQCGEGSLPACELTPSSCPAQEEINDVRWSPDGKLVAIAYNDSSVDIYKNDGYAQVGSCKGHVAGVVHIDWSTDSKYLQTNSGALGRAGGRPSGPTRSLTTPPFTHPRVAVGYEVLHHTMPKGGQPLLQKDMRDVEWATWTSRLGWPVKGIFEPGLAGSDVNDVFTSPNKTLVATADTSGRVRILKYPCPKEQSEAVAAKAHSSFVTRVRFTQDNKRVLSAGGNDMCIIQWKLVQGAELVA